jgi:hypothetical protein
MTGWQRNKMVEERAELILADQPSAEAYATYFEIQMHRVSMRRLLFTSYLWFARAGRLVIRICT